MISCGRGIVLIHEPLNRQDAKNAKDNLQTSCRVCSNGDRFSDDNYYPILAFLRVLAVQAGRDARGPGNFNVENLEGQK